ncbi:hypothetical protein EDD86DRAFT_221505 [Gorgonomyces haynaldii]|nr:hypothetical protein EDD86DRAFT_221505 [Gorgonomyces haynaldii]
MIRKTFLVSQPHPLSNMRMIRAAPGTFLSAEEQHWLTIRQSQILEHHEFWKQNNIKFESQKQAFMEKIELEQQRKATSDEMSAFYKHYLESNRETHVQYNNRLWQQNIRNLVPGIRMEVALLTDFVWSQATGFFSIFTKRRGYHAHGVTVR